MKNRVPWNKGKKGVQVAWNKNLTKETDKRVAKYAQSNVGRCFSEESNNKRSNTWKKKKESGYISPMKNRKKEYVVWNKGKTNLYSEETRKSMGLKNIGQKRGGYNKGKPSKNKGKTNLFRFTEEEKLNLSKIAIEKGFGKWMKGRKDSEETRRKKGDRSRGHICSEEQKKATSFANSGEKNGMYGKIGKLNPTWKGGYSISDYGREFSEKLKEKIRQRDNWTCQECNKTQSELKRTLSIHHIDYNKKNNDSNNLISLCFSCHACTNGDRENWISHFQIKIGEKINKENSFVKEIMEVSND